MSQILKVLLNIKPYCLKVTVCNIVVGKVLKYHIFYFNRCVRYGGSIE